MFSLRFLAFTASALLPMAVAAPVQAAVTFSSDAYTTNVQIMAGSTVMASATTGAVSGTAGAAYNLSGGVASVNQGATLATNLLYSGGETLQAGAGTTSASSGGAGTNAATASATLANASFGMTNQLLSTLSLTNMLNLGIGTISSTTNVGMDANGLYATGTSLLSGLNVSGSLLTTGIDGSLFSAPAANTVLLSLAGLKVVLNEQIRSVTDTGLSMQTNAVHIALSNYALDGSVLNGDIIMGHSAASVAGVPEPASWATMIVGLGAIGAALRRRRATTLLA